MDCIYWMNRRRHYLHPQLVMLSRMDELVRNGSQFIISTHSPILMAYPDALIYMIDEKGIHKIRYEETEHYIITRQFLNNRNTMLKELLSNKD